MNTWVGNLSYNSEMILQNYETACQGGADVVAVPELALCGYPPEDLLLKPHFLEDTQKALHALAEKVGEKILIVGFAESAGPRPYNSAAVMKNGKIINIYRKHLLPNYGVFDEKRYFDTGNTPLCLEVDGIKIALTICEDIWFSDKLEEFFAPLGKIDFLLNCSASPFHSGKIQERKSILAQDAARLKCPIGYCNMVGGQDELVFDGRSIFTDNKGMVISKAKPFEEDIIYADIIRDSSGKAAISPCQGKAPQPMHVTEEIYHALVMGTKDYVKKNGFKKVLIGLSGGIDSALVAAIAVKALGKDNVIGITMPSRFNTQATINDAELLARNLGIEFHTIPIADMLNSFNSNLNVIPGWNDKGLAFENLQARIRGTMLMSLSNQFGYMVITTGNKSETAVGYSTLYGDTAGGFAMLKDVFKTMVYKLCRYINNAEKTEIIPETTITRPPSAELKDNQLDSDSLPPYEILDLIIKGYVELDKSAQEMVDEGLPADQVNRVVRMIDRNEYKRRQSPVGIKITPKAFGRDRRLPITNKYITHVEKKA